MRFLNGISRVLPLIGYHHVLMIFIALAIILLSLLLAGCSSSSPQIPTIFLISLFYERYPPIESTAQASPQMATAIANIVGGAQLEVRVGYFGICIQRGGGSFICNANATALAGILRSEDDPLNLVWVASTFKDAVVFPYLIIVAVVLAFLCFLLLATFPGWHEETSEDGSDRQVRPFPSRAVSQVALALVFIASVFVLVSVLWQHTASVAASTVAQDMGNGSVKSGVGTSAMVLGWFGFVLLVVVTVGLLAMILSISLLAKLADDV
ncbi:hypothetical protein LOZ53_005483 [Ophidiomyces ophidiicola]|uniref:Uncharacterized protein n=1 Tax=Ophidiomyces ophidiicola TaxID=1387563 RepID=A0ACB8UZ19_9EURO|nr:uncharacterized protein LOZ57_005353 [Ophidiomyces ophidiicola]KAI1905632.1 hypothetical protein LOZ64_006755 [Ophidiomyces ophidiicola]KAI1909966.1 hypothetical protein LOZ61_004692 [Ophidiomyces ophidiicola]KAI1925971.1 hypothetical protein LOZ60_003783 [Ophidiomyces ophidiicola]KAI1932137.1 hypothetical protein LOZ62_006727 [Ophidiomyces ophidiicola]KAI1942329.1 hypothetical protein LOZ57_005353 [Ophidiomyces ophidiicola]